MLKKSEEIDGFEIIYKIPKVDDRIRYGIYIYDLINSIICDNFNDNELDNILIIYDYFDEIAIDLLNDEDLEQFGVENEYIDNPLTIKSFF